MVKSRSYLISVIVLIGLIIADQLSKYLIRHSGGSFLCNPKLAFSISFSSFLFIPVWCILVVFLTIYACREIRLSSFFEWKMLFPVLILAGAFSNFLDRIHLGCVVDFINIKVWPIFNLADIFITIGIAGIIIYHFSRKNR